MPDYMDKIVSQLEAKQPEVVIPEQVIPEQVTPEAPSFDFDKEVGDLMAMFEKPAEPAPKRTVEDVMEQFDNSKKNKKDVENNDDFDIMFDEIYEKYIEEKTSHKSTAVEKAQLEQMLDKERARNNELFDKVKEFEWETKKAKTKEYPDDLQALVDYFKILKEDGNNQYAKMHLVGEMAKIAEPYTNLSMTPYINQRLGSGVMSETQGTQDTTLPPQNQKQGDTRGQTIANSFMQ